MNELSERYSVEEHQLIVDDLENTIAIPRKQALMVQQRG